jgi:eukaryotic-like serine/threonine-protein kinase
MAVSSSWISLPERYEVRSHIANGGMASVWEAHDSLLGRDVAVKVLAPHLSEDDRSRRRFAREARTAAGLSTHPNVVTIYDVGEHEGRSFIVMELLRGGTVADRLRQGAVDRSLALRWLGEAADALDTAHAQGIVHRDVKPANLLLDEKDRLAIGDFGIARIALEDQLTATGIVLGTASYISPEQAQGHDSTPASDRYSLAVLAFELLTGSKPFQAEHFAAQARMHVEDPPPPASERAAVAPAVDRVLERGMAKDPADRWETAAAFVDALREADGAGGAPTEATRRLPAAAAGAAAGAGASAAHAAPPPRTPDGEAPTPGADPQSRRTAWLLLAGLAAAAVALALLLSSSGGDEEPAGGDDQAAQTQERDEPAGEQQPDEAAEEDAPPAEETPAGETPAPGGGDLGEARRLHLAGYAANNEGDYERGLELSGQALDTCGNQEAVDPCGYALYETARALVGLGRSQEAVPFLERRLETYGDNSAGDVQRLLDEARGERSGNRGTGNGRGKGNDKREDEDDD